jgi:hypothetical protein
MGESGVYQNERKVVLADDDAFPLLSPFAFACVIMTDRPYRQLVLGDRSRIPPDGTPILADGTFVSAGGTRIPVEGTCAWADLRCVQSGGGWAREFPASVAGPGEGGTRGTASVLAKFPLLAAAKRRDDAAQAHDRMLALAGLTGPWLDRFKAALQQRHVQDESEKMTAVDDVQLGTIFEKKYENREGGEHLAEDHFIALEKGWPDDSPKAFAFRVLCMGALYTRYSSSHVFGRETESPNTLRLYAEALLRKAHELDPGLLPDDQLEDWVKRLRKDGGTLDCTAVLYGKQSRHLDAILGLEAGSGPLHQVRDEMIPLE